MQSKDDSLRELNSRLIAEIDKLRKENVNIKAENARLIQTIEENTKREAEYEIRIKKLEQSNKENINLKTEVTKLRNDIEEIKKKDQIITNTRDVLSTEDISSENPVYNIVDNASNSDELNDSPDSDISDNTFSETKPKPFNLSYNDQNLEKAESGDCVSSEQNTDTQEIKDSEIDIQLLIQELFLEISKEDCIKIVNIDDFIGDSPTIKLVHLFEKISLAEINTIQAKVEEIRSWYKYRNHFEKRLDDDLPKNKRNDKRSCDLASGRIYDEMLQYLSGISCASLRKRTQRAKPVIIKHYTDTSMGVHRKTFV